MVRILQQICHLYRFFKNFNFSKTPKFRTFWEILLFQSHSTANLQKFYDQKFSWSELSNIGHLHTGYYQRASKRKKAHIINIAENNIRVLFWVAWYLTWEHCKETNNSKTAVKCDSKHQKEHWQKFLLSLRPKWCKYRFQYRSKCNKWC